MSVSWNVLVGRLLSVSMYRVPGLDFGRVSTKSEVRRGSDAASRGLCKCNVRVGLCVCVYVYTPARIALFASDSRRVRKERARGREREREKKNVFKCLSSYYFCVTCLQ